MVLKLVSITPRDRSLYLAESIVESTADSAAESAILPVRLPFVPSGLPAALPGDLAAEPQAAERQADYTAHLAVFSASIFLVSVPVFFQAPLVQLFPWLSLGMTLLWVGLGRSLLRQPTTKLWGDLLIGFAWTWLAGSIYWGWLRWEPFYHLPVEALGLPFILPGLHRAKHKIGRWFYLGSLLGTAITDLYFYLVDLVPYWRQLMQSDASATGTVLQAALHQMYTPWGGGFALLLVGLLVMLGFAPLRLRSLHGWSFGGAILSTLLVDGLFWLAATAA
ncbi:DUF3120 domain-containing protein [Leptolyngbya sp. O-77]|uniref:DUF3120 domain-containing protein n=1 Tax=Leptolyngbya sp. O-77 TaxID=1080068 RepID=UPI00074D495C|nr:DUF3120 domain-containing protein [Leptolyngbya sp. O-77]BAU41819.1 hypothetical protein O77CONTIG1_01632 [Leptolyngbya sp. O-77]